MYNNKKENEEPTKESMWRYSWHNFCSTSHAFNKKAKLGQINCARQFCNLQCPHQTKYIDGKKRISCSKHYDTRNV